MQYRRIAADLALFAGGVVAVVLLWQHNLVLSFVLLAAWFAAIQWWHEKRDIEIFVLAALFGPLAEIVAVHFGVWSYANPSFAGIPLWLPLLWGITGVLISRAHEALATTKKK